jgi:hypothetical protein
MDAAGPLRCPVCKAGFRGTRTCSRCGADLSILITLTARAHQLREKARAAVFRRDYAHARALAAEAQKTHATKSGRKLVLLTEWLVE